MAFVVNYRFWPGTGLKGMAATAAGAERMIDLLRKHWRLAGMSCEFQYDGFQVLEVPLGKLTLGQKTWDVDKTGAPEITDETPPEVPEVPGPG